MPGSESARHTSKRRAAVVCAAAFVTLILATPLGAFTPSYSPSPPPQAPATPPPAAAPTAGTGTPAAHPRSRPVAQKKRTTRKTRVVRRKRSGPTTVASRKRTKITRTVVRRAAPKPGPKLRPKIAPKPAPVVTPAQAPATLPGREVYRADWETDNFSQAAGVQRIADDRIKLVTDPVAQGKYAARFEVRPGDNPVCCGDRAEISTGTSESEGMERYYEWWTRFDGSFPNASWQAVSQWHSGVDGVPPVAFYSENGNFELRTDPRNGDGSLAGEHRILWNVPLQRNSWYHLVMHVKWSGDDRVGFIELNVNGRPVVPKTFGRTMLPGSGNYFKQGYYRAFGIGQTGVIYHDGFRVTQVSP